VLAEKDITVDVINIDPSDMPEDLSDINPYNSVPTLIDRDLVLYDARVIIEYLDERFPHPPLMPVDPVSRAHARLTLFRVENDWYSLIPDLESGNATKANKAKKILKESLLASAEVFAAKPYFLSEQFSLVDASIAPILWRLDPGESSYRPNRPSRSWIMQRDCSSARPSSRA
jgi:RNA polymerase-associated protein